MKASTTVASPLTPRRICGRCKPSVEHAISKTKSLAFVPFVERVLCAACCLQILSTAVERMGV